MAVPRNVNFAVYFRASHTGSVACPMVDYNNRALLEVGGMTGRGLDADECIVGRVLEGTSIHDYLIIKDQDGRLSLLFTCDEHIATLAHHVPKKQ